MIDFPTSPVDGQVFSATNGVVYRYSTTYTSWIAQNAAPPLGGTGDFFASGSTSASFGSPIIVVNPSTVRSGNSGGWYNSTTGAYTPPAGRFTLFAYATMVATSATGQAGLYFYKNGVAIPNVVVSISAPVGAAASPSLQTIVDANGTDVFTMRINCSVASTLYDSGFGAFPLTGMQGPTGGAPGPVVGDFYASTTNVSQVATSTAAIVQIGTVVTGNSGGYYNPTTWRWTPPAGRYLFYGWCCVQSGGAGASTQQLQLTKNGVAIPNTSAQAYAAAGNATTTVSLNTVIDANGTDVFDMRTQSITTNGTVIGAGIGATPTQGMVGPQGPMGPPFSKPTMQLDNEVVLAAPATSMTVTVPPTAKAIEIFFQASNVGNANDATGLILNDIQGASINVGANHYTQTLTGGPGTPVAANSASGQTGWNLGGAQRLFIGSMKVNLSSDLLNVINADFTCFNASNAAIKIQSVYFVGLAGTTGFRLLNGSGTQFIAGSYMRVFAVQ